MKYIYLVLIVSLGLLAAGCESQTETTNINAASPGTATETIRVVSVPDSIKKKMDARGEQENAEPSIVVESPKEGAVIESSTVRVKVRIGGDLKGYAMGKSEDGTGNHVHVILDNQPYAAHYMWDEGFELRNVTDGEHTLRMFPSRPWHQSYKNEDAFKVLKFTVKNGSADESKPTTDANGTKLADPKEGADMAASQAGEVDFSKPLLTYSRPKGEYKGDDAEAIMIDFWLSNAKLTGDGGDYVVNYSVNGGSTGTIEKWEPVWLSGWKKGTNSVRLWLSDKEGKKVENGGYNETTREITVD